MSTGTTVIYNGVTISHALTKQFLETNEYDESGTDLIGHKFLMTFQGYVSTLVNSSTVGFSTNLANSTAAGQVVARTLLMEARQQFTMLIDGTTLLSIGPNNGKKSFPFGDTNNGPKPRDFKILQIIGGDTGTMKVEFTIEISGIECISGGGNTQGVLSNRWGMHDVIDLNQYTTRSITGRLRVVDPTLDPQSFRSWVIPPLTKGFRRKSIDMTSSTDGLTLDYSITDEEQFVAPPGDATEWDGEHVRISAGNGATTHDELHLVLEAPKSADKANLIALLATIALSKLGINQPGTLMEQAAIIDHLNKNKVEFRGRVQRFPYNPMTIFNLPKDNLGKTLDKTNPPLQGYDKDAIKVPKEFGTATAAGLFVCYLQSPCNDAHKVGGSPQTQTVDISPGETDTSTFEYTAEIPDDTDSPGNYDTSQANHIYTHYELSTSYVTESQTVQLPVALDASGATAQTMFVDFAPAQTSRMVSVVAQRIGAWPQMPDIASLRFGSNLVTPIGKAITTPRAPELTADGVTKRYQIELSFRVGLPRSPNNTDDLEVGTLPWDSSTVADNKLPATTFIPGLA